MRLILLGPPGAGKGTHAGAVCSKLGIPQISTGDILHAAISAGTEYGMRARKFVDAGQLVPDALIVGMVKARIARPDCANGFVFDGFPRTTAQTEAMEQSGVDVDCVLELDVDDEEIIKRLAGRRVHPASGRTYHVEYNSPRVADKDDETGEDLVRRDDDHEDAVRTRLQIYREQTTQLAEYYAAWADSGDARAPRYRKVDARGPVAEVRERILAALA